MANLNIILNQGYTFRIHITDIEPKLYGERITAQLTNFPEFANAVGGLAYIGQFGQLGSLGDSSEWTSEDIYEYTYYDKYTGNSVTKRFASTSTYTIMCNAPDVNYLIGQKDFEFLPEYVGLVPKITKFTARQTDVGENKIKISYELKNTYDGEDEDSFRSYISFYINGNRVDRYMLGNSTKGSNEIKVDDFGQYEVYIKVENWSWFGDVDYDTETISDTIRVNVRESLSLDDCRINYEIIDRRYYDSDVSGVEAYVDNYIDITAEAWSIFCDAINVARETVGSTPVEFTTGDMLSATMWNEAIEAFADVVDATGSYFDVERFTVSRGDPVTKELIDEVNAVIAAVIEQLT